MFAVLNDEIRRLSRVMEEFDRPFDADPATLQLYKKVIRLHCIYILSAEMRPVATDVVCICLLGTTIRCVEMAQPRFHFVLSGGLDLTHWHGAVVENLLAHCEV